MSSCSLLFHKNYLYILYNVYDSKGLLSYMPIYVPIIMYVVRSCIVNIQELQCLQNCLYVDIILSDCCINEFHAHLCPHYNVWRRVVYCCFTRTMFTELLTVEVKKASFSVPFT